MGLSTKPNNLNSTPQANMEREQTFKLKTKMKPNH